MCIHSTTHLWWAGVLGDRQSYLLLNALLHCIYQDREALGSQQLETPIYLHATQQLMNLFVKC